ncbi:uncharacterized protein METZ01_LOCUS333708, partial [marine metagenome]
VPSGLWQRSCIRVTCPVGAHREVLVFSLTRFVV